MSNTIYKKPNFKQLKSMSDKDGDFWVIRTVEHTGGKTYYESFNISSYQPRTNGGNTEIDDGWLGSESICNTYRSTYAEGKYSSYYAAIAALEKLYKSCVKSANKKQ